MAKYADAALAATDPQRPFTPHARGDNTRYKLGSLVDAARRIVPAAIRGEVPPTDIKALAARFDLAEGLVRCLLQQRDVALPSGRYALSFVSEAALMAQARDLSLELEALDLQAPDAWVRTQPSSPLRGVRATFAGQRAFGIHPTRRTGSLDMMFATYRSPDSEESLGFGGLVRALEQDRDDAEAGRIFEDDHSPLQWLSIDRSTAAMFAHAAAVHHVVQQVVASSAPHIFLQGRFEGDSESVWLASPARTAAIVDEVGYQAAARDAFGDDALIVVEAEGGNPDDRGLESRHSYVRSDGTSLSNEEVRDLIGQGRYHELDDWVEEEHRDIPVLAFPGELCAADERGRPEGGQALLTFTQNGQMRFFSVLNRSDGSRYWQTDEAMHEGLDQLARAFGVLEASDSRAGHGRREQFRSLELFDVPMKDPSGRENSWRIGAAVRQAGLPPQRQFGNVPSVR